MPYCVITFRSVTPAQRGEGVLRRAGIGCSTSRTPRWLREGDCGYCVYLKCRDMKRAAEALKKANVQPLRYYSYQDREHLEELKL